MGGKVWILMKPNEYIKKYNLKEPDFKFNHKEFVADLTIDFNAMVEYHRQSNWNYSKFQLCVKDVRQKFVSISAKSAHPHVNEKLWKYFYATSIGPMKDAMFGEQIKKERARRQRARNSYGKSSVWEAEFFFRIWEAQFRKALSDLLSGVHAKPTSSFAVLGLSDLATTDEIKKRYKELAFQYHPDKGGNPTKFREITEARDRCLMYAAS